MYAVKRSIGISFIATFLVLVLATHTDWVSAVGMSSSNYKIESDSVNFGGGLSESASYRLESTAGEVATGDSSSASFRLHAGYQQMHETYIAFDDPADDVTMSPSLGGITGGTSNGATSVTVTTDSSSGYALYIKASSSPAMQGDTTSDTIADYVPAGSSDYDFTVPASEARFGFSPEGADIVSDFLDELGSCGSVTGVDSADKCWDGLSTTDQTIASRSSANHPSGTVTTIKFRITVGASSFKLEDTYTATTTLTAVTL